MLIVNHHSRMTAPIQLSRKKATRSPGVRWDGLNKFLAFADLTTLSPVQRVAYLAYWYSSHIEMAGHRDFFLAPCKADHSEMVAALQAVGAMEQASVLSAALEAVHAASTRAPAEYANRFVAGVEFADLVEFDDAFERCTRSVPQCLMDYLDKHETQFIEWRP
jgi:hypothetical protein